MNNMLLFPNCTISTPIMSVKKNVSSSHNNKRNMRWPPILFPGGRGGGGGDDELATVKAAAWAWYQRNEGKPIMREFDLMTRAKRTPRPSRYKLEANKNMSMPENKVSRSYNNHLLHGDQETKISSLLDPYEIKSISKRIDEDSLPRTNRVSVSWHHDDHVILEKKIKYDCKKKNEFMKHVSIRNLWKGMILMAPRRVCGRRDDVELGAYRSGPRTVQVAPTSVNTRTNRR